MFFGVFHPLYITSWFDAVALALQLSSRETLIEGGHMRIWVLTAHKVLLPPTANSKYNWFMFIIPPSANPCQPGPLDLLCFALGFISRKSCAQGVRVSCLKTGSTTNDLLPKRRSSFHLMFIGCAGLAGSSFFLHRMTPLRKKDPYERGRKRTAAGTAPREFHPGPC